MVHLTGLINLDISYTTLSINLLFCKLYQPLKPTNTYLTEMYELFLQTFRESKHIYIS